MQQFHSGKVNGSVLKGRPRREWRECLNATVINQIEMRVGDFEVLNCHVLYLLYLFDIY